MAYWKTFGKVEHSAFSAAGKEVFSIPCSFISAQTEWARLAAPGD